MKKMLYLLLALSLSVGLYACSPDNGPVDRPSDETSGNTGNSDNQDNTDPAAGKTLVVYYSYTNNVHTIVRDLLTQIDADVIRVQPAEKGLDYAANNYAIGSAQIQAIRNNPGSASAYPAIDPVDAKFDEYGTVIVAAPLWWSNMAAPLQTFLFIHGNEMEGKRIGLIVSSASSGISGVESDAKRLIPGGRFMTPSLWIRSSQTSGCHSLTSEWLKNINYGK